VMAKDFAAASSSIPRTTSPPPANPRAGQSHSSVVDASERLQKISSQVHSAPQRLQFAEKRHPRASGAKALTETKDTIAALKTLRHPNSEFFSKL